MPASSQTAAEDQDGVDQAAIRRMLSYVEAECLRIGATDAARHAAMAAALVPQPAGEPGPLPADRTTNNLRFH